jgi:hypothetical protein
MTIPVGRAIWISAIVFSFTILFVGAWSWFSTDLGQSVVSNSSGEALQRDFKAEPEVTQPLREFFDATGGSHEERMTESADILQKSATPVVPIRSIRTFFFSLDAWDHHRILGSKLFNPGQVECSEAARRAVDELVSATKRELAPLQELLMSQATSELVGLAQQGLARRGRVPTETRTRDEKGREVLDFSFQRVGSENLTIKYGEGPASIATWQELPQSKNTQVELALQIMERLNDLIALLQSEKILKPEQANMLVFDAVTAATSFQ